MSVGFIDATIPKLCYARKQPIGMQLHYPFGMDKTSSRVILAHNLSRLMKSNANLGTQTKLALKAGIAQTSVSNMLRPSTTAMKSPKLDQVEKVARAFGLSTWQLLVDPNLMAQEVADSLMRPAIQDGDARLKKWDASRRRERIS